MMVQGKTVAVAVLVVALLGLPSLIEAACQQCKHVWFVGRLCAPATTTGKVECEDRFGACRLWGATCAGSGGGFGDDEIDYQDWGAPQCQKSKGDNPRAVFILPSSEPEEASGDHRAKGLAGRQERQETP